MRKPRKTKTEDDLLSGNGSGTAAQRAALPKAEILSAVQSTPPLMLEYSPLGGERWRVEKFDLLAAEMDLVARAAILAAVPEPSAWAEQMTHLHELGLRHTRQWLIARKVFGIAPMFVPDDASPEDFQAQSRESVARLLGITTADLQAELDALRALWRDHFQREALAVEGRGSRVEGQQEEEPEAGARLSTLDSRLPFPEDILRKHGFDDRMFETVIFDPKAGADGKGAEVPRAAERNRAEKEWFISRVQAWDRMLSETRSESTAREALMHQLYLRRLAVETAPLSIRSAEFREMSELKRKHEEALAKHLKELGELFPELDGARHKPITLSDLNKAHREYYGRKDRELFDRVFTPAEREVLDRMSVQVPQPQYRFGQNIAIIEAMHNLYDPNFRPLFKPAELKKLDAGYKAGVVAWREQTGEPLVDLEDGTLPGEGSDYADLLEPAMG